MRYADHNIFSDFLISVVKVYKLVEDIKAKGGTITREPGPVKGGSTVIAFAKDPDGYLFELIQRGPTPEPLCQVMLRVGDLERSIKFYEKVNSFGLFLNLYMKQSHLFVSVLWISDVLRTVQFIHLCSLDHYFMQALGMRLLKKTDRPEQKVIGIT